MSSRALTFALAFAGSIGTAHSATLVLRAEGIRSSDGIVYVGVCATGFNEAQCPYRDRARARVGTIEFRIPNVRPGRYAIAVYHDVNGNGRLDRAAFLPTEPYGFSNGIGRLGPPSFETALVSVGEPASTIVVRVR